MSKTPEWLQAKGSPDLVYYILRGGFLVLTVGIAMYFILITQEGLQASMTQVVLTLLGTVGLMAAIMAIDIATPNKKLYAISGVFVGLLAGLAVAFALGYVVDLMATITAPKPNFPLPQTVEQYEALNDLQKAAIKQYEAYLRLFDGLKVFIGLIFAYLGITLVLQTRDDFRFVIPYVDLSKQIRGTRATLLDTSVIIDGRIVDILSTKALQGTLVVPRFVLDELQTIADSSDKLRRARGRRGLEILQKLQADRNTEITIDDTEVEGEGVDQKLITLAQDIKARVMTNDYNLAKTAEVRGVTIINLNELAKALRPVVLPGEQLTVKIVKAGESQTQGVGYLDDGTMVVVEGGRDHINEDVQLTVTSTLQTSAGRMIFGKHEDGAGK